MKWAMTFCTVISLALVFFPEDASAQKGNKNGATIPATPDDYKKLATLKELTGTVVSADRSTIVLRIDIPSYAQPNPGNQPKPNVNIPRPNNNNNQLQQAMQRIQQDQMRIQQLQQQIARVPPQQRQNLQRQIQQAQQNLQRDMQQLQRAQVQGGASGVGIRPVAPLQTQAPNIVMNHKDFQLDIAETATFRKKTLGTEYDNETGNIKVYTDAEKAKLKGTDPTKPGYAARPDEMNPGAQVTVYFAPAPVGAPKKDDDGNVIVPKPIVRMVYLLTEGTPQLMIQGNAKKKVK
jgi:TolA-binding protein